MFFDIFYTSCLYYINLIFMSIPLVYFLDSSKKSDFLQYGIKGITPQSRALGSCSAALLRGIKPFVPPSRRSSCKWDSSLGVIKKRGGRCIVAPTPLPFLLS